MGAISNLLAGDIASRTHPGDFTSAIKAIEKSIGEHEEELSNHWANSATVDSRVFSSCARLLLEQGAAVLLGRIDPLRLVTIIKGSSSPDFKLGYRNASSFIWNKDVVPDTKPGSGFWTQENIAKGVHRALLDGHLADYVFSSAHRELIDALTDATKSETELPDWIIDLLKLERGEPVLSKIRTLASEAYSTLSKGIHFEFFLGKETKPNVAEIRKATSRAMLAISTAALYSHFSDIAILTIDRPTAISSFLAITKKYHG